MPRKRRNLRDLRREAVAVFVGPQPDLSDAEIERLFWMLIDFVLVMQAEARSMSSSKKN